MIGSSFILATPQGQVLNTGVIQDKVGENAYLARFRGKVPLSRVVAVEQMSNWLIFDNEQHMGAWMAENVMDPRNQDPMPGLPGAGQAKPNLAALAGIEPEKAEGSESGAAAPKEPGYDANGSPVND